MAKTIRQAVRLKLAKALAAAKRGDCATALQELRRANKYRPHKGKKVAPRVRAELQAMSSTFDLTQRRVKSACPRYF